MEGPVQRLGARASGRCLFLAQTREAGLASGLLVLVVAINLLAPLVPFLRFQRQGGDRPGIEALQRNRLAGLLAEPVRPVFQPADRRVDLGDQLALPVAGAKFELELGFGRRAVGQVGMRNGFGLQVLDRFAAFAKDVFFPGVEFAAEILALPLIHKGFALRRFVSGGKLSTHAHSLRLGTRDRGGVMTFRPRPVNRTSLTKLLCVWASQRYRYRPFPRFRLFPAPSPPAPPRPQGPDRRQWRYTPRPSLSPAGARRRRKPGWPSSPPRISTAPCRPGASGSAPRGHRARRRRPAPRSPAEIRSSDAATARSRPSACRPTSAGRSHAPQDRAASARTRPLPPPPRSRRAAPSRTASSPRRTPPTAQAHPAARACRACSTDPCCC